MRIYEFCWLYIESTEDMKIWGIEEEKYVFSGTYDEARISEFVNEEVQSFGIEDGIIVINI